MVNVQRHTRYGITMVDAHSLAHRCKYGDLWSADEAIEWIAQTPCTGRVEECDPTYSPIITCTTGIYYAESGEIIVSYVDDKDGALASLVGSTVIKDRDDIRAALREARERTTRVFLHGRDSLTRAILPRTAGIYNGFIGARPGEAYGTVLTPETLFPTYDIKLLNEGLKSLKSSLSDENKARVHAVAIYIKYDIVDQDTDSIGYIIDARISGPFGDVLLGTGSAGTRNTQDATKGLEEKVHTSHFVLEGAWRTLVLGGVAKLDSMLPETLTKELEDARREARDALSDYISVEKDEERRGLAEELRESLGSNKMNGQGGLGEAIKLFTLFGRTLEKE